MALAWLHGSGRQLRRPSAKGVHIKAGSELFAGFELCSVVAQLGDPRQAELRPVGHGVFEKEAGRCRRIHHRVLRHEQSAGESRPQRGFAGRELRRAEHFGRDLAIAEVPELAMNLFHLFLVRGHPEGAAGQRLDGRTERRQKFAPQQLRLTRESNWGSLSSITTMCPMPAAVAPPPGVWTSKTSTRKPARERARAQAAPTMPARPG